MVVAGVVVVVVVVPGNVVVVVPRTVVVVAPGTVVVVGRAVVVVVGSPGTGSGGGRVTIGGMNGPPRMRRVVVVVEPGFVVLTSTDAVVVVTRSGGPGARVTGVASVMVVWLTVVRVCWAPSTLADLSPLNAFNEPAVAKIATTAIPRPASARGRPGVCGLASRRGPLRASRVS